MKRFAKLLVASICFITLICQFSMRTEAAGGAADRIGEIVDGSILTNNTSAEGHYQSLLRGTYLASGSCALSLTPIGVKMAGETFCYRICDRVEVNLYLEKLVGSSWETVVSRYAYATNTTEAMYVETFYAASGYYYRTRATHVAIKGSVRETRTSYSNSIYVG